MQVEWANKESQTFSLKRFLENHGVSHRMYADLKNHSDSFKVNGNSVLPSVEIKPEDVVTVTFPPEESDPAVEVSDKPISVLYEDENWLVVNKPAGLTSVPGPADSSDTLVNRVKYHLVAEDAENLRPHIITRLDRYTSGVALIAKNHLANSYANQQLAARKIDKRYLALVAGRVESSHGIIDKPIGRVDDHYFREVTPDGKNAKTEYWVEQVFPDYTLLSVKLHTGRTHQIRVHFTDAGHPLLGDQLYGGPMNLGIDHQALHAQTIKFFDPFQEKELSFTAPLPASMENLIQ